MSAALPVSYTLSLHSQAARANGSSVANAPVGVLGGIHSEELLRGQKAVDITHNGATYRLQATRLGKLILTK